MVDTTNLISYWKFDTNANDSEGSNDGTVNGATLTTGSGGIINEAYDFDGTNDYIEVTDDASLNGLTDLSISLWLKMPTASAYQCIFMKRGSGRYAIEANGSGQLLFQISDDGSSFPFTGNNANTEIDDDSWHHIVCVRDAGSTLKIYIDGSEEDSDSDTSGGGAINPTENLGIGKRLSGTAYHYEGLIDEVALFDKALTSTEVSDLYNSGSGLAYPFSSSSYDKTINGISSYSKVNGVDASDIQKINGVS